MTTNNHPVKRDIAFSLYFSFSFLFIVLYPAIKKEPLPLIRNAAIIIIDMIIVPKIIIDKLIFIPFYNN